MATAIDVGKMPGKDAYGCFVWCSVGRDIWLPHDSRPDNRRYHAHLDVETVCEGGLCRMFLLCLIPLVNVVVLILTNYKLAVAFGQTAAFTIGLIFLSAIFLPILAFGPAEYEGVPTK